MDLDPKIDRKWGVNDYAMELSHFGAKVLYPPTIQPVLESKIPINMALLRVELTCEHGKKAEAFCTSDKVLVCIDCILEILLLSSNSLIFC